MANATSLRWSAVGSLLLFAVVGCTAPGEPASTVEPSTGVTVEPSTGGSPATSEPTSATGRPVDPSIVPVSRSKPSAEASKALEACQIPDNTPLGQVIGMGLVPRAADLYRYINIPATQYEIQTDSDAWAIALRGEVPQPLSHEIWIDPTCVIIGG